MGKKSRLKKERQKLKELGLSTKSANTLMMLDKHSGSVYRFFSEEYQANALAQGDVWISTLETCRAYEDPLQGDPEEAHETYNSGHVVGSSNDPGLVEIARRSGIDIGQGCTNFTISNCGSRVKLPDAYVLCTTLHFSPEKLTETFGKYCVEITNVSAFFVGVSKMLENHAPIKEAAAGKVIYKDRKYTGLEPPPGPIGFVKPPDPYSDQKEFRFLWITEHHEKMTPFLLKCPEISSFCKRIA